MIYKWSLFTIKLTNKYCVINVAKAPTYASGLLISDLSAISFAIDSA